MNKKPLKPCAEFGCANLTRNSYCDDHIKVAQKTSRKARDKKTDKFYKSRQWQSLRDMAYKRDKGLCQRCLARGIITQADVVHHIIEIKQDWSLRLSLDNLESLCHTCHNRGHKATPRG